MGGNDNCLPLFETRPTKGRILFQLYAATIFVGISFICVYRVRWFPERGSWTERWTWVGLFVAELWFTLYWLLTVVVRWNPVRRFTFKDRLSCRYDDKALPGVDIFVCTADPMIEPPTMVINTVLSMMAYDYPPEKLSVYLSDDGGSELIFYAMLEAAHFSKEWLPFCWKFKVEPRSPEAYFRMAATNPPSHDSFMTKDWLMIKKLYEDMKIRIETTTKFGRVPDNLRQQHKGFREWDLVSSRQDHQTILQILIDGRDPEAVDVQGQALPTLVYLAREKRPQYHHNFKAGAMNALIRVSSRISDGPVILNVDCDMYSNNSESIRDALCFFLDQEKGHEIAYIQYPQNFVNITQNEIYGDSLRVLMEVEHPGFDGNGGPCYIGTGCFHRRETLCGKKYSKEFKAEWRSENNRNSEESSSALEESCKSLASCAFEQSTEWGKEMGLKYGCAVEDIITGLSIQCRGWKSVYFIPERKAFLGVAPTTLMQNLIQHKRWSEGQFQIFLSKYCPLVYGHKRIPLKLQLSYVPYNLWAPNSLAMLYYVVVPSLCLLKGKALFPQISSPWVLPFPCVVLANRAYSLWEFLSCGGTLQGWWNEQRIWMFKRTTSHLFGLLSTVLELLGLSKATFNVTEKVVDEDVSQRYEQEVMEFGTKSPMFNIIATLAMLNLLSCIGAIKRVIVDNKALDLLALQMLLNGLLVCLNLPVYKGLFFRKDSGSMPPSVTLFSIIFALLASTIAMY
ncbi:hypothetical protein SLA2020_379340 [Shorea laevis]